MLYEDNFLNNLQSEQHKVIYARVTLLSKDERALSQIEGKVLKGSINVDGLSAVRRTCSLDITYEKINFSNYLWTLENKFKLEIGLENLIDDSYPSIIWFPQGIFIITQFSSSLTAKNYQISISGKDKMCLLNGEIGGIFNSQVDFGKLEIKDKDNNITSIKLPIKKIIREMIHQYGHEPFSNIIINDLDETGLELLEYRLEQPLYIWRQVGLGEQTFINGTLDGDLEIRVIENETQVTLATLGEKYKYDSLMKSIGPNYENPTPVYFADDTSHTPYYIAKIQYGDSVGYKETELVYPQDLIAKEGQSITSVLDKIKKMLSSFEYFYNLEGQFVFQKKKDYRQISKILEGTNLITSFRNTPNISKVKNDFSVRGKRKTVNGIEIPIQMRKAIQKKPQSYTTIPVSSEELIEYNAAYDLNVKPQQSITYTTDDYDWREIIYRMALDYRKYNHLDDFELKLLHANKNLYPTGLTGYEQYYIDLEGFWRELYNPGPLLNLNPKENKNLYPWLINDKEASNNHYINILKEENENIIEIQSDGNLMIFSQNFQTKKLTNYQFSGYVKGESISITLEGYDNIKPIYDSSILDKNKWVHFSLSFSSPKENDNQNTKLLIASNQNLKLKNLELISQEYSLENNNKYWNKNVLQYPESLNFYFDLIDTSGELNQYSVEAIGDRPKVVNDSTVKAISYREIPFIIFGEPGDNPKTGYRYFNVPGFNDAFSISYQSKSAEDEINHLLSDNSYCLENVSITTIPIYNLNPNIYVYINDLNTGINGNFLINKYSINLDYKGLMNLSARKQINKIY